MRIANLNLTNSTLRNALAAAAWVTLLGASAASAQTNQSCSGSLNVDIHYCKGGSPVGCNPSAFTDGMPVEITVDIGNSSTFVNPPAPGDPPAGDIVAGSVMKVYYSCSASSCASGTGLAGRFSGISVASIVAGGSFVDDGNGYSGTLTFNSAVTFARGDMAQTTVLVLDATASLPPATNGEMVFARAGQPAPPGSDDSDVMFLITDTPTCLAGITGGGQGTTAGLFASAPPGGDIGFCRHPNKQRIKIDRRGALEYSKNMVSFVADPSYDPSLCGFDFGYVNAGGQVVTWSLAAGDLTRQGGVCYLYQDRKAYQTGGVQLARVCEIRPDEWCVHFKGWDDFDANLTTDVMEITVAVPGGSAGCGGSYQGPQPPPDPTWRTSPRRWVLPQRAFFP